MGEATGLLGVASNPSSNPSQYIGDASNPWASEVHMMIKVVY